MGYAVNTTNAQMNMMLPVPMRASPTTLDTSAGSANWGGAITQGTNVFTTNDVYFNSLPATNFGFTQISGNNPSAFPYNYVTIGLGNATATGVSAPLTAGAGGLVYIPNTAGKYIGFSAEL